MTISSINIQKPGLLTTVAVMTLVSGIINLFWGFVASLTALGTILGAVCLPLTILPTILGVVEIVYAAKLLSAQPQPVQPSQTIAILETACFLFGNVFSMVVGILALVFYNDLAVKAYFARLNGAPAPYTGNPEIKPFSENMEPPVEQSDPEPVKQPSLSKPKLPRKVARK